MSTHKIPFFQYKKENLLKLSQICNYGICSKELKNEFETAVVDEPSVFQPLKFYCIPEMHLCFHINIKCTSNDSVFLVNQKYTGYSLDINAFISLKGNNNNTELYDLEKIICLRKSEVSVKRNSNYNVTENLAEHGIHCLPSSTNDVIDMLP